MVGAREGGCVRFEVSEEFAATKIKTPIGSLWLVALGEKIWSAEFEPRWVDLALRPAKKGIEAEPGTIRKKEAPIVRRAARALDQYFRGELDALGSIPLALEGPGKRVAVWKRVRKVRAGHTMSYAELANAVGMPGAFRAIGAANGA